VSSWIMIIIAGLLEACWAIGLKLSDGFTRPVPSLLTIAAIGLSMWLLSQAARTLPMGTAYGVWVGIGTVGAVVLGVVVLREPLSVARAACVALLVAALIGLKLTTPSNDGPGGMVEGEDRPSHRSPVGATTPVQRHTE
jgi:quaternary ammonium compound-resistance protein SugE